MNQTKTNKIKPINLNEMLIDSISESKYIKYALYFGATVVGLFALGFTLKALNYSAHNLKTLQNTLK